MPPQWTIAPLRDTGPSHRNAFVYKYKLFMLISLSRFAPNPSLTTVFTLTLYMPPVLAKDKYRISLINKKKPPVDAC